MNNLFSGIMSAFDIAVIFLYRDAIDIQRRIAYLSQAAICVQSTSVHEKVDSDVYELMLEIRDKLDVAQVQLATRWLFFYPFHCL